MTPETEYVSILSVVLWVTIFSLIVNVVLLGYVAFARSLSRDGGKHAK